MTIKLLTLQRAIYFTSQLISIYKYGQIERFFGKTVTFKNSLTVNSYNCAHRIDALSLTDYLVDGCIYIFVVYT